MQISSSLHGILMGGKRVSNPYQAHRIPNQTDDRFGRRQFVALVGLSSALYSQESTSGLLESVHAAPLKRPVEVSRRLRVPIGLFQQNSANVGRNVEVLSEGDIAILAALGLSSFSETFCRSSNSHLGKP